MYNHYAALIPVEPENNSMGLLILNDLVNIEKAPWWKKTEEENVVINADETFLLFHPFGEKLLAPRGVKHVGTAVQVDNKKFWATVMIACEYWTSSILPPMVIFTGVYCAKLMMQGAKYSKGMLVDCFLAKILFSVNHFY
jgi:hypothetical protein